MRGSSANIAHHEVVLRGGARDAEGVGFLEGVAADELGVHLASDRDQRNGIHQGVDQAGDQISGAGAGCGAADADLAGSARITRGREGGILFVANQDVLDVGVVNRVVEGEGNAAGVAEEIHRRLPYEDIREAFRRRSLICRFGCRTAAGWCCVRSLHI